MADPLSFPFLFYIFLGGRGSESFLGQPSGNDPRTRGVRHEENESININVTSPGCEEMVEISVFFYLEHIRAGSRRRT